MTTERANRSDHYQYKFAELAVEDKTLHSFEDQHIEQPISDEMCRLNAAAIKRMFILAEKKLTVKQYKVLQLVLTGMTQTEAGKELAVNQSVITKTLLGNRIYKNGTNDYYGGIKRKLMKICLSDTVFRKIIRKMQELEEKENE